MKKTTCGLIICGILLNFESDGKNYENEFSSDSYYSSADFRSDFTKFSENFAEFKKIKSNINNTNFTQKIKELEKCLTKIDDALSDIIRRQRQNRIYPRINETKISNGKQSGKNQKSYYENHAFVETFEKDLRGFNSALQNRQTRFNTILNKGHKIFDNEKNAQLFNPNKKISSDLKDLFKQIHNTRYPEALNAWLEIKYMPITDEKFDKKLNNFKEKVGLLYRDVQKIKPLTKSDKSSTAK